MADEEQQTRQTDERAEEQKTEEPAKEQPKQQEEVKKTEEPKQEEVKEAPSKTEEAQKSKEGTKEEEPRGAEATKEEEPKKAEPKKEQPKPKPESKKEEARKEDVRKGEAGKEESRRDDKSVKQSEVDNEDQSETSEGRVRQREFFKEELRRLQDGLKRESSKIVPPNRRKYTPFVFNTLEPYYNTYTTRYLIDMPDESEQFFTFSSRNTAQGLTDPWTDLRMDQEILPQISSRPNTRSEPKLRRKKGKKSSEPNRKEGSTRLPKFPVVTLETKELATKQLYHSDVPMLRKELKTKYSSQARTKVDADYKRTQQDFYRMELDRMEKVAPTSRRHLTSTYMAYLQNTPGSRRAVSDCVRTLEGKAN
ncbi:neurofilament heavy polypeptide-like isoform X2 [Littorina saxatilis]|uniref:neurofilament heavy polypeptide-like isoform X2 n=1 Tax=Littorina saxatilis TaxID=31220 RepID=UPI0038B4E213